MSAQTVRRVSQGVGKVLAAEQQAQSQRVAAGEEPRPVAGPAVGQRLEIAVDGQYVREQPSGATWEVKTAVLRVVALEGGQPGRVLRQEYHSAWEPANAFGAQVYQRAAHLGEREAGEVVILGDDAGWIDTRAAVHFPLRAAALGRVASGAGSASATASPTQRVGRKAGPGSPGCALGRGRG